MSAIHDPHFVPKQKALAFSALPSSLQRRFRSVRLRIAYLGLTLDRNLIHASFVGGGVEWWEKIGKTWKFLIGGYPSASDLPSLLSAVA
jgi:hypothetical protein